MTALMHAMESAFFLLVAFYCSGIYPFNQERKVDMFEKKKLWMVLAATTLVAACGGGNGGPAPSTGGDSGLGGDSGPGVTPPSSDEVLTGTLSLPNNQLIFNDLLLDRGAYTSEEPSGGIYGQAKGANSAPFQAFGFRVSSTVAGENLGPEEATGRIAISLNERDATVDTGAGEVAEAMQFVLTDVTLSTDANNTLNAAAGENSRIYIYGVNAAGETVNVDFAVPTASNVVRVAPVSEFVGGGGDATTVGLVFDVDAAFAAADAEAQTALQDLAGLSGRFDMNAKFTNVVINDPDGMALTSEPVTVTGSGQPEVSGGTGASGNIWIEELPPGI
jgi:hypothetical protein